MEGVAKKQALVDRYNEIAANYSDETADEMSRLQDEIEAQGLWDLDSQVDQAMDALRCPDGDARVETLSGGERRRVSHAWRPGCHSGGARMPLYSAYRWLGENPRRPSDLTLREVV